VSRPRRLLLDTDIGSDVDDAIALALVLACPQQLDLVAVTTVAGDAPLRARIAAGLLALAGRRGVDVCAGEERPLLRSPARFAMQGHERRCLDGLPDAPFSREPAPERILRAARETPGLELVAVGPLTNLARAVALDPELPGRVAGLTVMGGHVREVRIGSHVCEPGVDYNLCSDPEATLAVLGAGFRTTLITADVTLSTWMTTADRECFERAGPLARALAAQIRIWTPVQQRIFTGMGGTLAADNAAFLHDPLTVLALIDPTPLRFERLRIATTIERGVLRTHELQANASEARSEAKPSEVHRASEARSEAKPSEVHRASEARSEAKPSEVDQAGIGTEMRVATGVDAARAARAIVDRIASA
jgi:purine nucleosidase